MNKLFTLLLLLGTAVGRSAQAAIPLVDGDNKMQLNMPMDARCSVSLGSSFVDYGTLSQWQLQNSVTNPDAVTPGKRTLMLSVVCPYSQKVLLTLRGERATNGDLRYGDLGSMIVRVLNAQLDGESVQLIGTSLDSAIKGAANESRRLQPGQTFAPSINGQLAKGKAFTALIEIEPMLPKAKARVSSRQSSEARFKLELMN